MINCKIYWNVIGKLNINERDINNIIKYNNMRYNIEI